MRIVARVSLCALAAAVLLVAAWGCARFASGLLSDVDLAGAGHLLMAEIHRGDDLGARNEALNHCLTDKQEVVNGLLAGRLSLREAADEFRRIDDEVRVAVNEGSDDGAAGSDEAVYGNLLAWARRTASGDARLTARYVRLEAEVYDVLQHRALQGA